MKILHFGGYEGSVAGVVHLEDDDNGTLLEDTRKKILLEIRDQCPYTTVEIAGRGITGVLWTLIGELLDPLTVLRLRATSSCWNQSNPHGDTAELWFFLMRESREDNGPVHASRAVKPDEETKHKFGWYDDGSLFVLALEIVLGPEPLNFSRGDGSLSLD